MAKTAGEIGDCLRVRGSDVADWTASGRNVRHRG